MVDLTCYAIAQLLKGTIHLLSFYLFLVIFFIIIYYLFFMFIY